MKFKFDPINHFLKKSLAAFLLLLLTACAVEVENPGKPDDGKQPTDRMTPNGSGKSTQPDSAPTSMQGGILGKRPSSVSAPTLTCSVVITRGAAGSSGKEGAVLELTDVDVTQRNLLVYRDTANDRFLNVVEQVFLSGAWSAGTYPLEYVRADGKSCGTDITISTADVDDKVKLHLELSVPD